MHEHPSGVVLADRYEIVRDIGRGSFGRTFLARDRTGERDVAIKMLERSPRVDLKGMELFEREAAVLRAVRHHGIPEVFDLLRDTWDRAPATFLVMEFVEGMSLAETIEQQRALDPADVLHLFLEMLSILEYLHSRLPPVVHRDIKPSNIIVRPDGHPALVDFGSVRRVFREADEAGSTIAGTYGYMPYEQYMGQATPASDLYSLGATFLHLLTGRPPREFMTADGRIAVPASLPGDPLVATILARLLEPSPADRFASAVAVRQALLSRSASLRPMTAVSAARQALVAPLLAPVPRPFDGETRALFDRLAPTSMELMDSTTKPGDETGLMDWLFLGFFSLVTVGILPITYISLARTRRRRLKRFLRDGHPATASILSIVDEKLPFEGKIAKVTYQFEIDGILRRDADQILPVVANRWQPGDTIQILYLANFDFDSVIISHT